MNSSLFVIVIVAVICAAAAAPKKHHVGIKPHEMVKLVDPPMVLPLTPRGRDTFIIGGHDVDPRGKYPWQVSILFFGSHMCGGNIINENTILTAAHCCDYPANWYSIAIGLHKHSEKKADGVQIIGVEKFTVHESYGNGDGNYPNDIALIHLSESIQFGDFAQPISLDDLDVEDKDAGYDEEDCLISGWGYTSVYPSYETPDTLQETSTKILSNDDCKNQWGRRYIGKGHVCIKDGESSACMGDSGGPLVCRKSADSPFRLVGVTSWGSSRCSFSYPGVYTRVSRYVDWVNSKLA